jgi:hypothetical protein
MVEETIITLGSELDEASIVPPLVENLYPLRLKKVTRDPNKAGTGFNFVWDWEIHSTGKKDADGRPIDGRGITDWTSLPKPGDEDDYWSDGRTAKEGKLFGIKQILTAVGYNYGKDGKIDLSKLAGATCKALIRPDKDQNGRPVNRIVEYKPAK